MKKTILQYCSLSVLAIILVAVSANAQTFGKYETEIPFSFQVGEKKYEPGDYIVELRSANYLATILSIKNTDGRELQRAIMMKNGNESKKGKTSLVFNRYGNRHVLKQIVSKRVGLTAPKSKGIKGLSKVIRQNPQTVSVVLVDAKRKFE
ncbi:MAG: hypothetical protein HKN25_03530 [Pyrinomonadaceae bacterium]|nr:hypothetical protein [Pyrinomonadaceae bacterium]